MATETKKSRLELSIDLIKAGAWPLFALIVLFIFLSPFRATANLLPNIVGRATSIQVGDLAIKIGRNIPPPREEVRQVLAAMSPDDISKIITTVPGGLRWFIGSDVDGGKRGAAPLLKLGLIEEVGLDDPQRQREGISNEAYVIRLTPLGEDTHQFLTNLVSELTQEVIQK